MFQVVAEREIVDCNCSVVFLTCEWSIAMGHSLIYLLDNMSSILKPTPTSSTTTTTTTDIHNNIKNQVEPKSCQQNTLIFNMTTHVTNLNLFVLGEKEGGYSSFICKMDKLRYSSITLPVGCYLVE